VLFNVCLFFFLLFVFCQFLLALVPLFCNSLTVFFGLHNLSSFLTTLFHFLSLVSLVYVFLVACLALHFIHVIVVLNKLFVVHLDLVYVFLRQVLSEYSFSIEVHSV